MYNYVQSLLVGKTSGGANTGNSLATITKGDILVLNRKMQVLTSASDPAAPDNDVIYIAQGNGAVGKFSLSSPIQVKNVKGYSVKDFAPATEQVTNINDTLFEAEKTYVFRIVYKTAQRLLPNRQDREVFVIDTPSVAGGFTKAGQVTRLVNQINNSKFSGVIVSAEAINGGAGIRITGKEVPLESINQYEKVSFTIALEGFSPAVTVVTPTKAFKGNGVINQIKELEDNIQGQRGISNRRQFPIPVGIYEHDPAAPGYDVMQIASFDKHQGDLQFSMESPILTTIAFSASAATQKNAVKAVLDKIIKGVEPGA